jgi:hypothetical protein
MLAEGPVHDGPQTLELTELDAPLVHGHRVNRDGVSLSGSEQHHWQITADAGRGGCAATAGLNSCLKPSFAIEEDDRDQVELTQANVANDSVLVQIFKPEVTVTASRD